MKRKKTLKGISLMEVVISIAVYGVISLLLAEIMGCVNNMMTFTNHLSERIAVEGKIADNQETSASSTRGVVVSCHLDGYGHNKKFELNDAVLEYSPSGATTMSDSESAVHFRYMNYQHHDTPMGSLGESPFQLNLNMSRDLRNFKALPEYATKGVVGIKKIEVTTVNNFIDKLPANLLVDKNGNNVSTLTYGSDEGQDEYDFQDFIDAYTDGETNNLLTINLAYDWINPEVDVIIKFYPEFDSSYTMEDSAKDQPYAIWNLDVHEHYKTTGVDEKWYYYLFANYSFDGYNVKAVDSSAPTLIPNPSSPT
ncbi:MAG: hypothetical protein MJ062_03850 [Oscillospiraceae bacterium]|nr:hypothetical protein [Oscillospiraceae bacterium]